ncbi:MULTISPECIES: phage minor head protein [Enterobacteriaceae]|uniref:phage head morphogenesis protein n=1 Tax=Enterobacteriaceae TaxID=543 RepID=UPI002E2D07E9|nr:phage minor head protein [Klebsiella pneumoniae]MED6004922.1 phage minor head protein [Klebsiella pneumoniae]MED6058264.1 phage minor head protein [Klebsiella pneumoniae]
MIQRGRAKTKKIQEVSPSKQLEVRYRRELDALLRMMLEIALDEIRKEDPINDALPDYFKSLTAKMNRIFDKLDSLDLGAIASSIANRVVGTANRINAQRFDKQASKTVGIDLQGALSSSGKAVQDQLEIDRQLNASLIKSVATEFKQDIADTIMANVQSGERSTNLITQIKERYGVSQSRAKLIARDQTSKLNGSLTKARSQALGSKTYIWSGVGDERERDTHRAMNGKLCRWDDPTVYSDDDGKTWKKRRQIGGVELHPTEDYQCRCAALAQVEF